MGYLSLKDVSFDLDNDEFVVILGASGAGKTTSLNLIGGMNTMTKDIIELDGIRIDNLIRKD